MSEMIKRVAKAIHDNPPSSSTSYDAEGMVVTRDYTRTAKAAIEAMREPTEVMAAAAYDHLYNFRTTLGRQQAAVSWGCGIGAALQEKEAGE